MIKRLRDWEIKRKKKGEGHFSISQSLNHLITGSSISALTFVELLMAATMFSILAVGFSAHLRGGVLAWRRATSTLERLQEIRVAYDRLGSDLTNAIVFDPSGVWQPEMAFGTDVLRFYTVQRRWREGRQGGTVDVVRYALDADRDGQALSRSVQSVQAAAADEPIQADRLLGGVASWRVRYGYAADTVGEGATAPVVWREEWDHAAAALPKLIEITIELADRTAGISSIRRVVMLPQGRLGTTSD